MASYQILAAFMELKRSQLKPQIKRNLNIDEVKSGSIILYPQPPRDRIWELFLREDGYKEDDDMRTRP